MRLTRPQLTAQQRLLSLRGSVLGVEEMAYEIATTLGDAIGWDGYRLLSLSADGSGYERLLAAAAGDGPVRLQFLRDTYGDREQGDYGILKMLGLDRPFASLPRCVALNPRLADCHGVDPALRAGADPGMFDDLYERVIGHYARVQRLACILVATFPGREGPVASLHGYRLDGESAFTASAVAFVSLVAPLVGDLLERAIARDAHHETLVAPRSRGVLVVGQDGAVAFTTPLGEQWVRALGQAHADLDTGLPTALWVALKRLAMQPAGADVLVGIRGGRARIEVAPGGGAGLAALVIGAERPPDDVRPALKNHGLTMAEERVARLVARGLSNRAVAAELSVSANTVEWHLRRVYDKVGVRGRAQLVGRIGTDRFGTDPPVPTDTNLTIGLAGRVIGTSGAGPVGDAGPDSRSPGASVPVGHLVSPSPAQNVAPGWLRSQPGNLP